MSMIKKSDKKKLGFFDKMMGVTEDDLDSDELDPDEENEDNEQVLLGKNRHGINIDLIDKGDMFIFRACIPSIGQADLDVSVTRELVTVEGETSAEFIESGDMYIQQEIETGYFSRNIFLPEEIDPEYVKADIKDGILTLKLPKLDKKKKMRVEVKKR